MMPRHLPPLLILALLGVAAGCSRDEVHSYRVPKEEPPTMPATASANAAATGGRLAWIAPTRWQEQPASGMRQGSFSIPGPDGAVADLSIIAFPGAAGGLADNLNRWRGQLALPTLPAATVESTVQHLDTPAFHADVVDYVGTANGEPTRIVGAIINHGGQSWFFKLMGPDALVAGERDTFLAFLQTVAPATP